MKKLMSLILSAVLMVGMATTAFAAEAVTENGMTISIDNVLYKKDRTISVWEVVGYKQDTNEPIVETKEKTVTVFYVPADGTDVTFTWPAGQMGFLTGDPYERFDGVHEMIDNHWYVREEISGAETVTVEGDNFLVSAGEDRLYQLGASVSGIDGGLNVWLAADDGSVPAAPAPKTAAPAKFAATLDGAPIDLTAFVINDFNHIKLRDMAALLKDTGAKFNVGWDGKSVTLTTGESYTPGADDLADVGTAAKTYTEIKSAIVVDGKTVELTAYNIDGYNYFQLRDLGEALGFSVSWDNASRTVTIGTK